MAVREMAGLTWEEAAALDPARTVAVLPIGALEAHGPHLPLDTDVVIAEAMARAGADRLAAAGRDVLLLPPLAYAPAPFARGFAGTVSIRPETLRALVVDIAASLADHGTRLLAFANAHLDPAHVGALRLAADAIDAGGRIRAVFPDVTRRRLAQRLTEEFRSGACHAGRYETSLLLAAAPGRVRDAARADLEPVTASLVAAIAEGRDSFEAAGGPRAYFGDPAAASADEGRATIAALGAILEEAVLAITDPERSP